MLVHLNSSEVPPARTVLLGGGGFIGRAIRRALEARGADVVAPPSRDLDLTGPDAHRALSELMRPTDAVVMLAAVTRDRDRSWTAMLPNIRMAAAVCGAIEAAAPAHVVYMSSDAVYPFQDAPIDEETPAQPQDLYGTMHLAREMMLRDACEDRLAILRPAAVYGAEDTHNAYGPNRFLRSAERERAIHLFGAGEETRDHIHVEDVASVVVRVLCRRSRGLLNVVTGTSWSFAQVAGLVSRCVSPPAKVISQERRQPVTHRRFDPRNLFTAFPDVSFRSLDAALQPHAESRLAAERC